jgi:hypothetical protein
MSEAPPSSETKTSAASGLLTFIGGNIASFSAIGLVASVLCSTIFLYAYLSVFDRRLIWIIDYPDIFKVGLIVLAVLFGAVLMIVVVIVNILAARRLKRQAFAWIGISGVVVGIVSGIWSNPPSVAWDTSLYLAYAGFVLWLLALCFGITMFVIGRWKFTVADILPIFALSMFTMIVSGAIFGLATKHSTVRYDIFLKDREMSDVRLVLFTSHHVALYAGNQTIVLPTADIVRIVVHPKDAQQK